MATNGNHPEMPAANPSGDNLGNDEVAWFFVEQYYTTLSKTPEKLHLFYGKRSQFVFGREAEVANVSVGRQTIQERIKALDLQDCKVRVSNVDSQTSHDNIVIQVIGETSNKAGDPKKFVQTFVLAQQPSGYFVLNDILRYIDDEGESGPVEPQAEESANPAPAKESEAPEAVASSSLETVDKKLEESATPEPVDSGAAAAPAPEAAQVEKKTESEAPVDPESTAQALAEEDAKEPEKPVDPSPTPVAKPRAAPAAPAAAAAPASAPTPAGPPKPMTWASRAAAAAAPPKPVVPLPKTATPPASQPRAAAPSQPAATQAPAPAAPNAEAASAAPVKDAAGEWQTAGNEGKRQTRPQSISGPQAEKDGTMGYVKYVTDKVKHEDLKAALAQHGELVYFDINRQKNCAFVEFANTSGYLAAAAANPHNVNGESIMVEPRRPKAGAYGGANYTAGRGGNVGNRGGRGGFDGRSGSQGGRGNFGQNRGRGGSAPRGRGPSQPGNA